MEDIPLVYKPSSATNQASAFNSTSITAQNLTEIDLNPLGTSSNHKQPSNHNSSSTNTLSTTLNTPTATLSQISILANNHIGNTAAVDTIGATNRRRSSGALYGGIIHNNEDYLHNASRNSDPLASAHINLTSPPSSIATNSSTTPIIRVNSHKNIINISFSFAKHLIF
jgi:hypothetical protein